MYKLGIMFTKSLLSVYKALLDIHNIELLMNGDGGERGFDPNSISSSSLQQVQFLERFMNAFSLWTDYVKIFLAVHISSECLPIFTAATLLLICLSLIIRGTKRRKGFELRLNSLSVKIFT